jgi:hypothetical protein
MTTVIPKMVGLRFVGTCDDKCCEYTMEHVSHGTLWMSKFCFLDKAGVLFVSEIAASDES